MKFSLLSFFLLVVLFVSAQENDEGNSNTYKKRALESTEIDFLMSVYAQDGSNAAVTGGIGTEKLYDGAATLVVSVPLNDDDILAIDANVSAYASASSSNINPFDGPDPADAFTQSSGASVGDVWVNFNAIYTHNSDDRNTIWSGKLSVSNEHDYTSFGFGGSLAKQFNSKNTELSLHGNVYLDTWRPVYPYELRPFGEGGSGLNDRFFRFNSRTGNYDYNPTFTEISDTKRNSYSLGLGFTQILSKKLQGSLAADFVLQNGLLSTPFHRIYFSDVENTYMENFHLADAIEKLPDTRFKIAVGGRLNYYMNERFVFRTYYRYYFDDWGIQSNTLSLEIPIKITDKFTLYPSYRFYNQSQADYFAPYDQHLSSEEFYTSDYDLSKFFANQYGFGITYTDIFTKVHLFKIGLKSIDLKYNYYQRNSGFNANIVTFGFYFVFD